MSNTACNCRLARPRRRTDTGIMGKHIYDRFRLKPDRAALPPVSLLIGPHHSGDHGGGSCRSNWDRLQWHRISTGGRRGQKSQRPEMEIRFEGQRTFPPPIHLHTSQSTVEYENREQPRNAEKICRDIQRVMRYILLNMAALSQN
jgi:hypothetical protein